jgi:hypothetical protein
MSVRYPVLLCWLLAAIAAAAPAAKPAKVMRERGAVRVERTVKSGRKTAVTNTLYRLAFDNALPRPRKSQKGKENQ